MEEIPDELPELHDLPFFDAHAKTGGIAERPAVALAVALEERDGVAIVGDDVDQLEMEGAARELADAQQEAQDRVAAGVIAGSVSV